VSNLKKKPIKNNYNVALKKGWEDLLKKDPKNVAKSMKVTYLAENRQFIVPHLNEKYIVDCIEKKIINRDEVFVVDDINLSILILHYLSFFLKKKIFKMNGLALKKFPMEVFYFILHSTRNLLLN